jgi:hypothetical protein
VPAAGRREAVEFRAVVVLRNSPLGRDQLPLLQPMERWIERAHLDSERVIGHVLDPARDAVVVHRASGEGLEDQDV